MGEAFFNTDFFEDLRTRDARGAVTQVRDIHDDIVIFDRQGTVYAVRSEQGKIREGDNLAKYMLVSEWQFLRENSLKFSCERVVVDTKCGGMVVFCNMAASMRIMIGVIFHIDRSALVLQYAGRATSLTKISPRMRTYMPKRKMPEDSALTVAEATADLAFRAFMSAGVKERLIRSPQGATAYIIDRACIMAEFVGCRIDCRSARTSVPMLQDFNVEAYVAILACLMLFVWDACPARSLQMKIGDIGGRPYPIIRCEPELGDEPIFVNRRYRHTALHLCDGISTVRDFLFECSTREDEDGPHLRICFSPAIKPAEILGVKEPIKKLDYSDLVK